ncbi:hypothetical protein [Nitrosomonas sp. Is79A3]|uniref:hypothetical protein n=1 Tax=Nitrosomonas sp. (strain Is79A3) TaxID=261292 RepID=UPI0018DE81D3
MKNGSTRVAIISKCSIVVWLRGLPFAALPCAHPAGQKIHRTAVLSDGPAGYQI